MSGTRHQVYTLLLRCTAPVAVAVQYYCTTAVHYSQYGSNSVLKVPCVERWASVPRSDLLTLALTLTLTRVDTVHLSNIAHNPMTAFSSVLCCTRRGKLSKGGFVKGRVCSMRYTDIGPGCFGDTQVRAFSRVCCLRNSGIRHGCFCFGHTRVGTRVPLEQTSCLVS